MVSTVLDVDGLLSRFRSFSICFSNHDMLHGCGLIVIVSFGFMCTIYNECTQ